MWPMMDSLRWASSVDIIIYTSILNIAFGSKIGYNSSKYYWFGGFDDTIGTELYLFYYILNGTNGLERI